MIIWRCLILLVLSVSVFIFAETIMTDHGLTKSIILFIYI